MTKRIVLMTGGGDCAGLNAAIRAVVRAADQHGWEVIGIRDGFEGLVRGWHRPLSARDVPGILRLGGTILGSSNRTNPFAFVESTGDQPVDVSDQAHQTLKAIGADTLITIGGDGTLFLANRFARDRIQLIGIPKTIDNDVHGTEFAIGVDTCVTLVTSAIDKLHTTAESHHRILLVEVMGRTVGWIALYSAIVGGADIALLPERPFTLAGIVDVINRRSVAGKHFAIAVVAEGISLPSGGQVFRADAGEEHRWKFGGVCARLQPELEAASQKEVRTTVLGHLQRGGSPTAFDRLLATQFGYRAVQALAEAHTNVIVGSCGASTCLVPLEQVAVGPRSIPSEHPLLAVAQSLGVYVG